MSCRSCSDLCIRYRIGSPSELGKAIRIAFQNVQDGTLREVDPPENDSGPTFSELAQGAAWGDVVSFGFECQTCGQSFRLHAETYHGSGGYWESVTSNTIERSVQAKILIAIAAGDQEACDALFDVTCAIEDPEMKADVLNNLLVMPGHELHQQIAMEIQRLKSPSSVPYIRSVLMKGPRK
jgi:hypothetical protein